MYEYRCKVVKVIDGDTVDVDIDLGFGIWQMDEHVRIMGIDTPESRTRDKVEKKFGLAAKAKLKELLKGNLVGVANMKLDASISEGTNFAIKSSTIENFLNSNKIKTSTTYLSFSKSRDGLLKLLESTTVFVFCE